MNKPKYTLTSWQEEAKSRWIKNGRKGIFKIFTGGGKTIIAMSCLESTLEAHTNLQTFIVVPTEALAVQWEQRLNTFTQLNKSDVSFLKTRTKKMTKVMIVILNTASKNFPKVIQSCKNETLVIVDECHKAGSKVFSQIFDQPSTFILGLSATPERQEVDDDGFQIPFDKQLIAKKIGPIVFEYSIQDAIRIGWLPKFTLSHHGITLSTDERNSYREISKQIDEIKEALEQMGVSYSQGILPKGKTKDTQRLFNGLRQLYLERKHLLYQAKERHRIVMKIVTQAIVDRKKERILLFHERSVEAGLLYDALLEVSEMMGLTREQIGLEHSGEYNGKKLTKKHREDTIQKFRDGKIVILVSVKTLLEGLDVPAVDVGIAVASSSSIRQRIQSLGRVLRKTDEDKVAEMHLVYAQDTVDTMIYKKEDWHQLIGDDVDEYYLWNLNGETAQKVDEAPGKPLPTEDEAWQKIKELELPQPWNAYMDGVEFSIDTSGTVWTKNRIPVSNSQGIPQKLEQFRGTKGGKVTITFEHRLVLATKGIGDGQYYVIAQLEEVFAPLPQSSTTSCDVSKLKTGDIYTGELDKSLGEFMIKSAGGGFVEKRKPQPRSYIYPKQEGTEQEQAVFHLIQKWKQIGKPAGLKFYVTKDEIAWYIIGTTPYFLGKIKKLIDKGDG